MRKHPQAKCELCSLMNAPYVPSHGSPEAQMIIVGEAPGREEAREGEPFVGQSGRLLNAALEQVHHTREDVYLTNVVACHPTMDGYNREPSPTEIWCCTPRLIHEIEEHNATKMLLLGKVAQNIFLGEHKALLRGMWADVHGKQTMTTWHPAYVLRKPSEGNAMLEDIWRAFRGPIDTLAKDPPEVVLIEDIVQLQEALAQCPDGVPVAYDLETNQIQWYDTNSASANSILMMSIAWEPNRAIVLDDTTLYDTPGVPGVLEEFFRRVLPVAHNGKFDNVFLRRQLGVHIDLWFDTLLSDYILDENKKHGLKLIAQEEFGIPDYEEQLISEYLRSKNDEYSKIPFDKLAQYGAWDVCVTLELQRLHQSRLEAEGMMDRPFMNVIMPMNETLTRMQLVGMQIDTEYLQDARKRLEAELVRVQAEAGQLVGRPSINLNSPKQVGVVLWDQLHLPQIQNRKVKEGSTAEDAVAHLHGKHPFVDHLLYYRSISKLKSSYIDNMLEYADTQGRVHPDGLIYGTEMGRISMRNPAAQTIPRPSDRKDKYYSPFTDGALIRGAVITKPGYVLVIGDYSQAELRVLAVMAREDFLINAYKMGRDIHSEVAVAMYGPNYTKEDRVLCKMFNFSYVYGGTEYSFAEGSGLPVNIARQFVRQYNELMPAALEFKQKQFQTLLNQGYVETLYGRRRRFPFINDLNRDDARKASVHAVIAGTASDTTMMSAYEMSVGLGYDVVLVVHDSILVEVPEADGEHTAEVLARVMMDTASKYMPEVPWKVDVEVRKRWTEPPSWS